jgi:hypothetical protein
LTIKITEPNSAVMNSRLSLCVAISPLILALPVVSKKFNVARTKSAS